MSVAAVLLPGFYARHISLGMQTGDANPPVETVAFAAGAVGSNFAQIVGTATDLNGPIRVYAVALADSAAAPSEAQIVAGTDAADSPAPKGTNSAASGVSLSVSIAGLSASTAYDIYYTLLDAFDNAKTAAKIDVTTTAASAYDPNDTVRPIASGSRMVRSVVDDIV